MRRSHFHRMTSTTLWARAEGWAAGLRLAELSLRNHPDPSAFVAAFAGDDRAVSDYLMSEVVSGYDEDTLLFLLRTSIVDRLNGELAEALADVPAGEHSLRELERVDGFVDALDSSGTWFRYYPLFAEVLRAELRHRLPDELPALHSSASDWFARHGQPVEAVRHAVAASDWQLAADDRRGAVARVRRPRLGRGSTGARVGDPLRGRERRRGARAGHGGAAARGRRDRGCG